MTVQDRYGWLDRLLHRTAFRTGTAQHALADVEKLLYEDALEEVGVDDPVFITALPRAGTTILLRLLWWTGRFASHTYQDMPFLLCPLLWRRYARQFADEAPTSRPRAHDDGLEVSEHSPEAFEERVWKHFWPDHYQDDRIRPWREGNENPEFDAFFETHLRKVIAVRRETDPARERYLSKNNLNVARLAALPAPLRRGTILIPFRAPVQQAASMLRQHRRFTRLHEEDDFVREYMAAIGHHEFGKELRPVNFGGWLDDAPDRDPNDLAFWVRYWIAAYRFVLRHGGDTTVLLSYARLTDTPEPTLSRLAEVLSLPANLLVDQADQLRPPRTHDVDEAALPDALVQEASSVHDRLEQRAGVGAA